MEDQVLLFFISASSCPNYVDSNSPSKSYENINILIFEVQKTDLFPSVSLSSPCPLSQLSTGYFMLLKHYLTEENEAASYTVLCMDFF